jgi:hypothetical protein
MVPEIQLIENPIPQDMMTLIAYKVDNIATMRSLSLTCKDYNNSYSIDKILSNTEVHFTHEEHTKNLIYYAQKNDTKIFTLIINKETELLKEMRTKIRRSFGYFSDSIEDSMQLYKGISSSQRLEEYNKSFTNWQNAVWKNDYTTLTILILNKVGLENLTKEGALGKTLLIDAVRKKPPFPNFNSIELLLISHCAKDNQDMLAGWTALHSACYDNNKELVELLIKYKCNLNLQDRTGNTPLHLAANNQNILIAQLLIENGADITIKNREKHMAFSYLTKEEDYNVLMYCAKNYNNESLDNKKRKRSDNQPSSKEELTDGRYPKKTKR